MGMSANGWSAEHRGHRIDVEVWASGFLSGGASLFVDDQRVDTVPQFKSTFSRFTLRHCLRDGEATLRIRVEIRQRLGTSAKLFVDDAEVPLTEGY